MNPIGKALRKAFLPVAGLSAAALLAFGLPGVSGTPPEGTAAASWVLKPAEADQTTDSEALPGERETLAMARAYPTRIEGREIREGEWALRVPGAFTSGIAQIQGYHWREIAGTQRRSYHGYGAAVDVIPRSYGGRFAYWRWAFDAGIRDWWDLPDERLWLVPRAFVDAMEAEGFVWGGKWLWYDTVHFEYRPEVLRLAD